MTVAVGSGAEMLAIAAAEAGRELAWRPGQERDGALIARLGSWADLAASRPDPLYIRAPDATPKAAPSVRIAS